jgi:C4-dicarboxylate transporter DctM subunit
MMLWMFVLMLLFFAAGVPVAWSMALAATLYMGLATPIPLQAIVQRLVGGVDSFPLLAIPFFILAGNLMNTGGVTDRLVAFARVLVGHITGGLAHVVVVTNMIMAGMSGSGVADAAGSGAVLIPAMERAGYGIPFAAAIVGAAGTIGPIIPPSIPFVVFGSMAGVSIGRLLLAGAVPGVLMGIALMAFAAVISRRRGYPRDRKAAWREFGRATLRAIPPLGMPVIILGGIIGGIMTPTESAAAGATYALILGMFVYHEITWRDLPTIIEESTLGTAAVMIIMAAASPFAFMLTLGQAPQKVMGFFQAWQLSQWQVLLVLNIIVLILGCFMEGMAILIMATPVLMPLVLTAAIDPVHFGVIFVINIMIGTVTPPVGTIMYVVCALGKISISDFAREIWPFLIALIFALFVVTYVPFLSLWLPNLLMPVR